jgi:hypothetical protein
MIHPKQRTKVLRTSPYPLFVSFAEKSGAKSVATLANHPYPLFVSFAEKSGAKSVATLASHP